MSEHDGENVPLPRIRICRCESPCTCITEEKAIASSAAFLRERFGNLRCDHEAVSCCVRCNVMYLVKVAERAVAGHLRYLVPLNDCLSCEYHAAGLRGPCGTHAEPALSASSEHLSTSQGDET